MKRRTRTILQQVALAAACVALAGCSMSNEWWVREAFLRSGFDKSQASCAAKGILSHLAAQQASAIRAALSFGDRPDRFGDTSGLLDWLRPKVDDPSFTVIAHYAAYCRPRATET